MAVDIRSTENPGRRLGEQTPLLRESDDESGGLSVGSGEEVDENKANQRVGRGRALLIILSLWALIFLQGT